MRLADTLIVGRDAGATLIADKLAARGERVLQLDPDPPRPPSPTARKPRRIALRPRPVDLDDWARRGLPEWSWACCLPALRALETDLDFDDPWHGRSGPVQIQRYREEELRPWQAAFMQACAELGFERCEDLNAPGALGCGPLPLSEPLEPTGPRLQRAIPRRLRVANGRVDGLELQVGNAVQTVHSARVVLCGGVSSTLGLLLRSGIGPAAELRRLGLNPVLELQGVGSRLLVQPVVEIALLPRHGGSSIADPRFQTGLRLSPSGSHTQGEVWLQPGSWRRMAGQPMELLSLHALVSKPRQTHSIRLDDADPRRKPRIVIGSRPADPDDVELATDALELAWLAATSSPMRELAELSLPSARVLGSRRRLRHWIRRRWTLGPQIAGTAAMGPADDPLAVTDAHGRVHGLKGLWIADASLMPSMPASDPHLTTLLLAQRLASWLSEA